MTKAALELRRQLWKNEVFTADDGGTWRVEAGNLLICERNEHFLVAVAMGTEPVQAPGRHGAAQRRTAGRGRLAAAEQRAWVLRG